MSTGIYSYRRFGGAYFFRFQVKQPRILEMDAVRFPETSMAVDQSTRRNIPEDLEPCLLPYSQETNVVLIFMQTK